MPDSFPSSNAQTAAPDSSVSGAPLKHDASTGFRDIKPIPEFSPINFPLILGVLLLLFVIIGARHWMRRRRELALIQPPPPSPEKIALQELALLLRSWEQQSIALRELSHKLSLTLRSFLEATLKFPATDSTVHEISRGLPRSLAGFRTGSQSDKDKLGTEVIDILKHCDRLSFSDETENYHKSETVQITDNSISNTVKRIEVIVRTVVRCLAAEEAAIKHEAVHGSTSAAKTSTGDSVTGNNAV